MAWLLNELGPYTRLNAIHIFFKIGSFIRCWNWLIVVSLIQTSITALCLWLFHRIVLIHIQIIELLRCHHYMVLACCSLDACFGPTP